MSKGPKYLLSWRSSQAHRGSFVIVWRWWSSKCFSSLIPPIAPELYSDMDGLEAGFIRGPTPSPQLNCAWLLSTTPSRFRGINTASQTRSRITRIGVQCIIRLSSVRTTELCLLISAFGSFSATNCVPGLLAALHAFQQFPGVSAWLWMLQYRRYFHSL
jgi:hypothetical protein